MKNEGAEKDKVISGLECCLAHNCRPCPYAKACMAGFQFDALCRDALTLIRGQKGNRKER